jgi:ABC-type polysaccharide/polyol phosphate transport system ATPase subunit/SAM-dependent methyltransferase
VTRPQEDIAIRASGLSKTFRLPHETRSTLREYVVHPFRRTTYELQQALVDVSLTINPGEFFGVIGRNGSGKSTLLKILAGIYRADSGSIEINGKLSPFIELGVGFNPELNARDNIRINGTLLGLSPRELARRFDGIVAFAELERFVDQSLKNYSSGMQLRLAYAIAIQVPFDILLLDEVLAVGDQNFQEKCFDTFERMRDEGKTVVLVTHGLDSVARFCDRALLLRDGAVQMVGPPEDVIQLYLSQERGRGAAVAGQGVAAGNGEGGDAGLEGEESFERPEGAPPDNGRADESAGRQALRELALVVRRSREETGRRALGVLERVIRDQEARLEDRAARLSQSDDLRNELQEAKREILQLSMMTAILRNRHYEEIPLPSDELRLRIGKTASETNFLAQGLTAADRVMKVFGESPPGPMLEFGCGSGRTARWLVPYPGWQANYHGCDPDAEAIAWLTEQSLFPACVCSDDPPLPYSEEMFGGIFALTAFTRLPPEKHQSWYAELRRILAPGGLVFVATLGSSMARPRRGSVAAEFNASGRAYISRGPFRSGAFVSIEFTRQAVEGLFTVENCEERSYGRADTYVLKRVD